MIAWRTMIWAMTTALAADPQPGPGGSVMPRSEYAAAMRIFATSAWPAVKDIFENVLGGAPLVTPSGREDLVNPDLRPLIDRYYRGTGATALERIKLFKLIWDAIGTEFGGRHELYERNYAGNHEHIRVDALNFARRAGVLDDATARGPVSGRLRSGGLDHRNMAVTAHNSQLSTDNSQLSTLNRTTCGFMTLRAKCELRTEVVCYWCGNS